MRNKGYETYIKNLKKEIPREYKNMEQFISSMSLDVENYLESCPNADYDEICSEFGSPEELVHSLMEDFDSSQIKDSFFKQKRMRKIIYVLAAILLIFLFFWVIAIPNMGVRITETIYIHETETIYMHETGTTESEVN